MSLRGFKYTWAYKSYVLYFNQSGKHQSWKTLFRCSWTKNNKWERVGTINTTVQRTITYKQEQLVYI